MEKREISLLEQESASYLILNEVQAVDALFD